mgnify:CR=1 FL=1
MDWRNSKHTLRWFAAGRSACVPCSQKSAGQTCTLLRNILQKPQPLVRPMASLEGAFLFSLIWSVGGACNAASRSSFDRFLRALLARRVDASADRCVDQETGGFDLGPGVEIWYPVQQASPGTSPDDGGDGFLLDIPEGSSVFDLLFDPVAAAWRPWLAAGGTAGEDGEAGVGAGGSGASALMAASAAAPVPHEATPFNEIVVPTVDRWVASVSVFVQVGWLTWGMVNGWPCRHECLMGFQHGLSGKLEPSTLLQQWLCETPAPCIPFLRFHSVRYSFLLRLLAGHNKNVSRNPKGLTGYRPCKMVDVCGWEST